MTTALASNAISAAYSGLPTRVCVQQVDTSSRPSIESRFGLYTEGAKLGRLANSLLRVAVFCALALSVARAGPDNLLMIRLLKADRRGTLTESDRSASMRAKTSTASWVAGRIEWRTGSLTGATALWETAADSNVWRIRCLSLDAWQHGRHQEAITLVRIGLDLDPSNETLANLLGAWRLNTRELVALRRDLQAVLIRAPRNATALAYRGWAAYLSGQADAALPDLEHSLSLDPDNPAGLRFLAEFLTNTGGSRNRIEELLLHGDRRWPAEDVFCYGLAQFYIAGRRYDVAGPYVERLRNSRPNDAYVHEVVGGYHFMRGQHAAALEEYQIAGRLVPSESRFFIEQGDAFAVLGRRTEAEAAYMRAAELNDWRAPERLVRLKGLK